MLNSAEINQLIVAFQKVFPTRDEVVLKVDFDAYLEEFRQRDARIEKCVTALDKTEKELSIATYWMHEHDKWLTKASKKIDIPYSH